MPANQSTPEVTRAGSLDYRISWPRPATPCNLEPLWKGEFASFDDWCNFASKRLTGTNNGRSEVKPICVDALGRRCSDGGDFMRARDENAFPVRFFWECTPPATPARGGDELREALEQIAAAETQWANATVRKMASIARQALASTDMAGAGEAPEACPVCHGDCGSANPPVIFCPMRDGQDHLTRARARAERRAASGEVTIEGSIYEGMEACLVQHGRTIAHVMRYADAVDLAARLAAPPVGLTSGEGDTVPLYSFDEAWGELVNKDDRTSPEEYPDMCLITREELRCYMEARQYARAASPAQPLIAGGLFACRFDGVAYSHADLQIAQRAACAIVPLYGTGDHGEQEAAQAGKLWNDHPAVQGALRALHEARVGTAPNGALEAIDRFVTDHVGNDDTPEGIEVDQRAQEAVAVLRAMFAASPKATATASVREEDDEARNDAWNEFFNEHLTDGNDGYRTADVIERCRSAFNLGWYGGLNPAFAIARASLTDSGTAATIGGERA